jgi:WD40 repeat protein
MAHTTKGIMATLKASPQGLARIKQARREKGWATSDFRWIEAASACLGVSWMEDGVLAAGVSEGTWKRFLSGKYPINAKAFKAYCQVLGLNWEEVVECSTDPAASAAQPQLPASAQPPLRAALPALLTDWGEAPDVSVFYGRQPELQTVRHWLIQDRCRLITLLGMGGIGKTSLAVKLARDLVSQAALPDPNSRLPSSPIWMDGSQQLPFERVIWRSLRNAPPVEDIAADLIHVLSNQEEIELPCRLDERLRRLLHYLKARRCLLILDNTESILEAGDRTGRYRPEYIGYGQLLHGIADTPHQSCLILTSREKPQGLAKFEGESLPVRSLQLSGLAEAEGRELFNLKGTFTATEAEWQTLVSRYAGNPLALKIVASAVHDYFDGDISSFLATTQHSPFLFDDIRDLLDQQFQRLTPLERSIMYRLAIAREPISLADLQAEAITPVPPHELVESLNSLQRRSLMEKNGARFTQQPVVMEYVTLQIIEQVCDDLGGKGEGFPAWEAGKGSAPSLPLLITHALLKATAKDYIRETQGSLILQPIVDRLLARLGSREAIATVLQQRLDHLRGRPQTETGYAAGNALNLLIQAGVDLTGFDGSHLTVWQAYLQGVPLHNVNFTQAHLDRCVFTETLGNILAAAFSPDGQLLATCDTDCNVRVWAVNSGKLLLICRGHANWVRAVAFSPDGKTLASCSADGTIRLWDVRDGVCIKTLLGHDHEVFAIAYRPDGQWLVSVSGDRTLKLWDLATGQCVATLTGHTNWVRAVAFSPDGRTLASSGADDTIRLWTLMDADSPSPSRVLKGHRGWVRSLAFSPDGEVLASASSDRTIKLWDYETGDCLRTYVGHQGSIYSIAFDATGDVLISGSGDRTVKFWDCASEACVKTLHGQTNEVCWVAVSSDQQTIACVSLDQTLRLWNYQSGQCLKTWYGHTDWALPVAFSPESAPESPLLASGSNDKTVRLWNWETGDCLQTLTGHTDFIYAVAFSPDGQILASGSTDCSVRLWRVQTGQCFQSLQGHTDWIDSVAFHPHAPLLASGSADCTVKLWDISTGQCRQTLTGHSKKILGVAFSPDGTLLASCGVDPAIQIWEAASGQALQSLVGHRSRIWGVAFSPQGRVLASCSTDQTIRLWDLTTGRCLRTLTGHSNWVFAVAFSPDGQTLASAAHDQTLRIWEVKTGACLQICQGHSHLVSSVAFSPDGRAIATGSQDQTVRVWDASTGTCLRILIAKRLYEGMQLVGVQGLTPATIATLQTLGAVG